MPLKLPRYRLLSVLCKFESKIGIQTYRERLIFIPKQTFHPYKHLNKKRLNYLANYPRWVLFKVYV